MNLFFKLILIFCLIGCTETTKYKEFSVINGSAQEVRVSSDIALRKSRNATVKITSFSVDGNEVSGSGAYVTHRGSHYILTAAHVVSAFPQAVISTGVVDVIASVVFIDLQNDTALLSVQKLYSRDPVPWRTVDNPKVGTGIVYSGFPNLLSLLTIEGKIAGFVSNRILIHSYVWKGSSGSMVINKQGKIVGVVSAVDVGMDMVGIPTIIEDVGIIASVQTIDEFLNK